MEALGSVGPGCPSGSVAFSLPLPLGLLGFRLVRGRKRSRAGHRLSFAVVSCFVAVDALEMAAVTESCNRVLPGAVLVVLL